MQLSRLLAALGALAVVAVVATGCGGSSEGDATAMDSDVSASGVVFGRGSVPDTVPVSFPIPDEAVVGTTLVDSNRGITEMTLTFPAAVPAVVTYYEENLPIREYEIASSSGTEGEWLMEFNGDGIDGEIRIRAGGSGLSSATVRLANS